jgi:hypothetical protein
LDSLATEEKIRSAARNGQTIEIRGYTFSERFQRRLDLSLEACLAVYGRGALHPVVLAVAQELCLWASLANMRQVYFGEYGLDLNDPDQLRNREPGFQASVNRARESYYRAEAKARGLYLRTRLIHNDAGMRIEILNNSIHSESLENRLREYLAQAMRYDSIMRYYEDHPEDQDGRGVGLALSVLMLKEERLRPELMRLGQSGDETVSRLEIPFDTSYDSIRDQIQRGEEPRPFSGVGLAPADLPPGVAIQDHLLVQCPICRNEVDDRVFFPEVSVDMLNFERVRVDQPEWGGGQGACASCLATYE